MMVNYGMDKMKFGQAVLSGQKIRMVADLHSLVNLRGTAKAEIKFAIEIEGQKKKSTRRYRYFPVLLQLMYGILSVDILNRTMRFITG